MADQIRRFLTEKELAIETGLSLQKLRADRQNGTGIPFVKFGRAVRYAREDLDRYVDERRFSSTSAPAAA